MVVREVRVQLEASLPTADVTIELSEPAKAWRIHYGYDEQWERGRWRA